MNGRILEPAPDPIAARLRREDSDAEAEDVLALIGFVGSGRGGHVRLYSDRNLQRWLDLPEGDIVDSYRLAGEDEHGRTVLWVRRAPMVEPMFEDSVFAALEAAFTDGWMSTWPLIPDSRYVAARILDLVADAEPGEGAYS